MGCLWMGWPRSLIGQESISLHLHIAANWILLIYEETKLANLDNKIKVTHIHDIKYAGRDHYSSHIVSACNHV